MMTYAKPKEYLLYRFGFEDSGRCYIHCFPQQKFQVAKIDKEKGTVSLSNEKKHIDLIISLSDFEKNWRVVE